MSDHRPGAAGTGRGGVALQTRPELERVVRRDRDATPPLSHRGFWSLVAVVATSGCVVLAVCAALLGRDAEVAAASSAFWIVMVLVLLGEARPIFASGSADPVGIATSTTFIFASLYVFGLPVAVVLHAVATVVAGVAAGRAWWRTAFNVGQYSLALGAAWWVLQPFGAAGTTLQPAAPEGHDLLPIVLASVTYFVVSAGLVWLAVALYEQRPLVETVRADGTYQVIVHAALLGLAPLVAIVMDRAAPLVPLFVLPLLAVYKNAQLSVEHERAALADSLTGLSNRAHLERRTAEVLAAAERSGDTVALFVLDLDRFKEINDTLGHAVGDRVLQIASARLQAGLRPGDLVARLGGDEFAILLPHVQDAAGAREVAERVRFALEEPIRLADDLVDVEASIGIALSPEHGTTCEQLLQRADVAMYAAKAGRTSIEVYSATKDRGSTQRLGRLGALRRGIDAGELVLHYQPRIDLRDGSVRGVEALVRWEHPTRGLVLPDDFLPLAEDSGLMQRLTDTVLESAVGQAAAWRRSGLAVPVAVNVSMRNLLDPLFAARICELLHRSALPPGMLCLEITERLMSGDEGRAAETLAELDRYGVRLTLDDFGTGHSSLSLLKALPVGEVKIDGSFVRRLTVAGDDATIVRSIVDLAHGLGLDVVAKGVETAAAEAQLRGYGCDAAQGLHLSPPMPAVEATVWLALHLETRAGLPVG